MENKLYVWRKTVTTAGTRERLTTNKSAYVVLIQAEVTNTGVVYVGDSSVSSTRGFELEAGDTLRLSAADFGQNQEDEMSLEDIWLDVATSGDGVMWGILES